MKQIAESNAETPQGAQYKVAFEEKFTPIMQQCVQSTPGDLEKFEFLLKVDRDGHADPGFMTHRTRVLECLIQTLGQSSNRPFHGRLDFLYWIFLELVPAKFVVASQ